MKLKHMLTCIWKKVFNLICKILNGSNVLCMLLFPKYVQSFCMKICLLQEIPPYNHFGSLEDSLQSCLSLVPQPPKKDFIKMLENDHKVLRFEAIMVW